MKKVLVVDDNWMLLKLSKDIFLTAGYQVITASDGVEAFKLLRKHKIDLILTDILMPEVDGYTFCYNVKISKEFKNIPVIIYTATYTSEIDKAIAMGVGANYFIIKPAPMNVILDAAKKLLSNPELNKGRITIPPVLNTSARKYNPHLIASLEQSAIELADKNSSIQAVNEILQYLVTTNSPDKNVLDISAVIVITDSKGAVSFANKKFCTISGYSSDELIGMEYQAINAGCHSKKHIKDVWEIIGKGRIHKNETRNKSKSGAFYWLDTTIIPFIDDKGVPVQYFFIGFEKQMSSKRI